MQMNQKQTKKKMSLLTHSNKMRLLDQTRVKSLEAEVNTTGKKGQEIEDHQQFRIG